MDLFAPQKEDPNIIYYNLIIGATAGTVAVTFTYPLDLTRRLMQLNGTPGHKYNHWFDLCGKLYNKEGLRGFFKGLLATYIRVAPMTAILFLTNEQLKK